MKTKVPKEKAFARIQFELMTNFLVKEYSLVDFKPYFVFSLSRKRKYSWGGYSHSRKRPYVNIAGHRGRIDRVYQCKEYTEYEDDPEIGTYSGSWQQAISGTIAHEMAHAAEMFMIHYSYPFALEYHRKHNNDLVHSEMFKSIYRSLRKEFGLCNLPK